MTGFKNFILRGNLVELAVAFIIAVAFAAVVTATVAPAHRTCIGKARRDADFSNDGPAAFGVGPWITAVIAFVIMAAVVYFFVVMPYTEAKERYFPSPEPGTPGGRQAAPGDPRPARRPVRVAARRPAPERTSRRGAAAPAP